MRMKQSQADRIISKFGGITPTARALGHKYPTTVQGWKDRGWIPSCEHENIILAGRKIDVVITPDDFIDVPPLKKQNKTSKEAPH